MHWSSLAPWFEGSGSALLAWLFTRIVGRWRARQEKGTSVHDRLSKLEKVVQWIDEWWNGVPKGLLRSSSPGFKDRFAEIEIRVNEHGRALEEILRLLRPNGRNSENPGDVILHIKDLLEDVLKQREDDDAAHP